MKTNKEEPSIAEHQIDRIQKIIMSMKFIKKAMLVSAHGRLLLPRVEGAREEESFAALMASLFASGQYAYKVVQMEVPDCIIISGKEPAVICNVGEKNVLIVLIKTFPDKDVIQKVLDASQEIDKLLG